MAAFVGSVSVLGGRVHPPEFAPRVSSRAAGRLRTRSARAAQLHMLVDHAQVSAAANVEQAWAVFSAKMKETNTVPPTEDWNELLKVAARDNDLQRGVWVVKTMRDVGMRATPLSYEILLEMCIRQGDKQGAFHLVEQMYEDKVPLSDVELPEGMEKTLKAILPPEAF
ncbi:hypothetical protein FVE85_7351 [Porphyridium purpureum]|uniref:Pentatricopeptide repeat-containing protein n=1 Tax=Porphyridium purpureum TaxID=35688 RepID=A0A5J4Z7Q6_PORPP|nr:hypothetical protein FVE85_7351 [Porphyridium purpureum]|eukprot:POR0544..scf295_1